MKSADKRHDTDSPLTLCNAVRFSCLITTCCFFIIFSTAICVTFRMKKMDKVLNWQSRIFDRGKKIKPSGFSKT